MAPAVRNKNVTNFVEGINNPPKNTKKKTSTARSTASLRNQKSMKEPPSKFLNTTENVTVENELAQHNLKRTNGKTTNRYQNVPPTTCNFEGLVPSNGSEAEHYKKILSDEVERRNFQKDLLIERDRNKQLHLQLQQSRQEISKLNETIGSLKSRLANSVANSKNEQGYGTRKTIPVKNENAFLIKIPCNPDYVNDWQSHDYPSSTSQQLSFQPTLVKTNEYLEAYHTNQLPYTYYDQSYTLCHEKSYN